MPTEDSYEGFGELTERANIWLSEQPEDVLVTNIMSIMVQKDEGGWFVGVMMQKDEGVRSVKVMVQKDEGGWSVGVMVQKDISAP